MTSAIGTAKGIAFMVAAAALFPGVDALGKYLASVQGLDVLVIVWFRYLFQSAVVLPLALGRHGTAAFRTASPGLQVTRGVLIVPANLLILVALKYMPLADTIAILFVAPILVSLLAAPLLGEHPGRLGWLAVVGGFLGALVMIRPGLGILSWVVILPFAVAFIDAVFQILTRRLGLAEKSMTTLLYTSLVGLCGSSFVVLFGWSMPGAAHLPLLAALGLLSGLVHYLVVRAFEHAPAPTVAPFAYLQLLSAAFIGYLVFDDIPDVWTVVGALVIVSAGVLLTRGVGRARTPRAN